MYKDTIQLMLEEIEVVESHLDALKSIEENPSKVKPSRYFRARFSSCRQKLEI